MNVEASGGSQTATAESLTPGEWLRGERERRGLSLQQTAEELRLDVKLVEAIEANRFAALGAPVYAKGHLRKYAMLLGLSPDAIIASYQALSDTPIVPTPIPAAVASPLPRERRSWKIPLWVAALIAAAALGWLVFELLPFGPKQDPAPRAEDASAPVNEPVDAAPATAATPEPLSATQTPVVSTSVSAAQPDGSSVSAARAAQEVRVRLEFSEPSWTEIYDGSGKRLMFDTGMPGRARTVSGVPPLQVTLGFASGVSASVDERPLVIPRRPGRDAARFSVQADGSVSPESSMRPVKVAVE